MTIEFKRGIGIGRTEVWENGVEIGYTQQEQPGTSAVDIRREEHCNVHEWQAVTTWTIQEQFPGDKAPKHWEEMHNPMKWGKVDEPGLTLASKKDEIRRTED